LATPNYGFEKRQKELAKKRKKEEKLKAKAERKSVVPHEGEERGDALEADEAIPQGAPAPEGGASQ
jgi:hypothetical protein